MKTIKAPETLYEANRLIRMLVRRLDAVTELAYGMHEHDWSNVTITKDHPIARAKAMLNEIPQEYRDKRRRKE